MAMKIGRTAEQEIAKAGAMVEQGVMTLGEAEDMIDERINEECISLIDSPTAWADKYFGLKAKEYKALLGAVKGLTRRATK